MRKKSSRPAAKGRLCKSFKRWTARGKNMDDTSLKLKKKKHYKFFFDDILGFFLRQNHCKRVSKRSNVSSSRYSLSDVTHFTLKCSCLTILHRSDLVYMMYFEIIDFVRSLMVPNAIKRYLSSIRELHPVSLLRSLQITPSANEFRTLSRRSILELLFISEWGRRITLLEICSNWKNFCLTVWT